MSHAGDERLSAVERLDIYANMYFFRIRDVLRDELAKTAALLGDDAFHDLVTDYLVACPPSHPSLREAGARLPGFLATHALGAERPWLAELARLERTRLELHDGPDAAPLSEEAVRRVPAEALGALSLRLVPCHALLDDRFGVAAMWRAEGPAAGPPAERGRDAARLAEGSRRSPSPGRRRGGRMAAPARRRRNRVRGDVRGAGGDVARSAGRGAGLHAPRALRRRRSPARAGVASRP